MTPQGACRDPGPMGRCSLEAWPRCTPSRGLTRAPCLGPHTALRGEEFQIWCVISRTPKPKQRERKCATVWSGLWGHISGLRGCSRAIWGSLTREGHAVRKHQVDGLSRENASFPRASTEGGGACLPPAAPPVPPPRPWLCAGLSQALCWLAQPATSHVGSRGFCPRGSQEGHVSSF